MHNRTRADECGSSSLGLFEDYVIFLHKISKNDKNTASILLHCVLRLCKMSKLCHFIQVNGAFPVYWPPKAPYNLCHIHTFIIWWQKQPTVWVQHLARGCFSVQPGELESRTSDLPITERPAPPRELQPTWCLSFGGSVFCIWSIYIPSVHVIEECTADKVAKKEKNVYWCCEKKNSRA